VDDVLAASGDGRWLVTREGDVTRLVDARSGQSALLAADARADALSFREHRFLSFDGGSRRLAYVRTEGQTSTVVVRELASGRELVVKPGPGRLHRARLDYTGEWLLLEVVAEDTNGNGRLDLPVRDAPPGPRPCRGPIPSFAALAARGDQPSTRAAPVRSGNAREVPGLVAAFERRLLVRGPGDELWLLDARGRRARFAAGSCRGHVIHMDVAREAALLACERTTGPEPGRNEVELWSGGERRPLGVFVTAQAADAWPGAPTRLVPLYPGREAVLVDLERGTVQPLSEGDHVLAVSGTRALVWRGRELVLVDVEANAITPLATVAEVVPDVVRQPPMVAVGSVLVDVERGAVVGTLAERALAMTRTGEILVALGARATPPRGDGPAGVASPVRGCRSRYAFPAFACANASSSARTVLKRSSRSMASACSTQSSTAGGRIGAQRVQARARRKSHEDQQFVQIGGEERRSSSERPEHHRRQAVDIDTAVEGRPLPEPLLGRDVARGSGDHPLRGDAPHAQELGEAEVEKLDAAAVRRIHDEDVLGLHVAVHDPQGVGAIERVDDGGHQAHEVGDGQPDPALLQPDEVGFEVDPVEQLHDRAERPVRREPLVDDAHGGALPELGERVGLAQQPLPERGVARPAVGEDLDRDRFPSTRSRAR
jgi:hypothetical protein